MVVEEEAYSPFRKCRPLRQPCHLLGLGFPMCFGTLCSQPPFPCPLFIAIASMLPPPSLQGKLNQLPWALFTVSYRISLYRSLNKVISFYVMVLTRECFACVIATYLHISVYLFFLNGWCEMGC